jgi:uncharacterized protein (DUF1800 family)
MALDPKVEAAIALHRFGLGPRAGSIVAIASDPRGALLAELNSPDAGRIIDPALPASGEAARAAFKFQQEQRARRLAERAARNDNSANARNADAPPSGMQAPDQSAPAMVPRANAGPGVPQRLYLEEAKARIHVALEARIGFVERLVWFWSNHFCVSADKGNVRAICGAYEREAIRANVLGRFGDMLLAAESHPAMLVYLDNARSIGPASMAGVRQKRGLNENLAREILELHTLGVRTVYKQEDVTSFANVITGWTVVPPRQDPAHAGEFQFNPRMHEPGAHAVIGKSYPDAGMEQGRAVLAALARHPATAKHVASKLARHFIADDPPAALVQRLAKRFLDSEGNLKELAKALVTAPEAWDPARSKLKRPNEWIISALRAGGVTPPDIGPLVQAQNLLGEPLWRPSAPKGFADEGGPWLDGLSQRLDIANALARRMAAEAEPGQMLEETVGPIASTDTREAVTRAESRPQALALLFMAPEFQRR